MVDVSSELPSLITIAHTQPNNTILFTYQFSGLRVRVLFFGLTKTLLIGITTHNIAWLCDVSSQGLLSESIPREIYNVIGKSLVDGEGNRSNKQFFLGLKEKLCEIVMNPTALIPTTTDEIKETLGLCKTQDRKYDKEGDRPYFDHWRRVPPSSDSCKKIKRYFGYEVKEACYHNKVTAVWSSTPKEDSLQFLTPHESIHEIQNLR